MLIIEDETKVARSLQQGLNETGYDADIAHSGEQGLNELSQRHYDLVILDLGLPGKDGIEVLSSLRQKQPHLPVIILSARDTIDDRVVGLESGADDYLIKPFAFPELLARIKVLLRRGEQIQQTQYQLADLEVDVISRSVTRQGQAISLTSREFELLEMLCKNINSIVSRQDIARDIWRVERATPLDNVIDVHIMRLRKKIDTDTAVKLIHTLRGMGYMLSEDPDAIQ